MTRLVAFLSRRRFRLLALPALLVALVGGGLTAIVIDDAIRGGGPCGSAVFPKSAVVFDALTICASGDVDDAKVVHAAAVSAQWLDNDGDGTVDDPGLHATLVGSRPVVLMTAEELSFWPGIRALVALRGRPFQDLGARETAPRSGRDASQEEIHHIIVNAGWQRYRPDVFSEEADDDSLLYRAWQAAWDSGLHFYDDPTCDDSCQVTEFVYLATAAYLGSDVDLQTDELRAYSRDDLQRLSPATVAILESAAYRYPTIMWPDGRYPHTGNITLHGLDADTP